MNRLINAIHKHRPKGPRENMLPSVSFRVGPDGQPTNIWLRMVDREGIHLYGEALPDEDAAIRVVEEKCNVYRKEEQKPPPDVDAAYLAFE